MAATIVDTAAPATPGTFRRRPPWMALAVLLLAVVCGALSALVNGWLLPADSAIEFGSRYLPPLPFEGSQPGHPLGTDALGRDVLARMLTAARVSLLIAVISIALSAAAGAAIGLVSGYAGGWVDVVLMRLVDVLLSFPAILVALLFVVTLGSSAPMLVTVVAVLLVPQFARLLRGEVLTVRHQDYVKLAKITGSSTIRILVRHVLPNVSTSILVMATLQIGWVITIEAALSFLGAGIPPPTPTWGNMIAEGRDVLVQAWWVSVLPGIAIATVVFASNIVGDWLRDTLDPRLRQVVP